MIEENNEWVGYYGPPPTQKKINKKAERNDMLCSRSNAKFRTFHERQIGIPVKCIYIQMSLDPDNMSDCGEPV